MSTELLALTVGARQIQVMRYSDGYLDATKLVKAYEIATGTRKDVRDWLKTDRAKAYASYLSQKTRIPVFSLVQQKRGRNGGTWIHPKLAIPFSTWLSVEFEFQVSELIEHWLTEKAKPNLDWEKVRAIQVESEIVATQGIDDVLKLVERINDAVSKIQALPISEETKGRLITSLESSI